MTFVLRRSKKIPRKCTRTLGNLAWDKYGKFLVTGNFSCKWILLFIVTYAYIRPLAFAERLRELDHMGIDGGES